MKILNDGIADNRNYEGCCVNCGCNVQVKETETKLSFDSEGEKQYRHITCPSCNNRYLWLRPLGWAFGVDEDQEPDRYPYVKFR